MTEFSPACPLQSEENAELFLDYCSGNLDPARRALLHRHIEQCGSCRQLLGAQRQVWEALDGWDRLPISPDFDERVFGRLLDEERPSLAARLSEWARGVSWKPAIPAAAFLALWIFLSPTAPSPSPTPDRAAAEQVERALEDLDMLQQLPLSAR